MTVWKAEKDGVVYNNLHEIQALAFKQSEGWTVTEINKEEKPK